MGLSTPMAARPPQPSLLKAVLTIMYGFASRRSPPAIVELVIGQLKRDITHMSCPKAAGVVTRSVPHSVCRTKLAHRISHPSK